MMTTHKLLIKISPSTDRGDMINEARIMAANATEQYEGIVFDWRDITSAEGYEENVLLGEEHPEKLIAELQDSLDIQRHTIQHHLAMLQEISPDIGELVRQYYDGDTSISGNIAWRLLRLGETLNGEYTAESEFFDAYRFTSKITQGTIDDVKANPKEWALAYFSCHY